MSESSTGGVSLKAQNECNNSLIDVDDQNLGIHTQDQAGDKPLHIKGWDDVGANCKDPAIKLEFAGQPDNVSGFLSLLTGYNYNEYTRLLLTPDGPQSIGDLVLSANENANDIILTTQSDDGYLRFCTTQPGTNEDLERMTITNEGHVGIFETAPKEALQIGERMGFHIGASRDFIGDNVWMNYSSQLERINNGHAMALEFNHNGGYLDLVMAGDGTAGSAVDYSEPNGGWRGMRILNVNEPTVGDFAHFGIGCLPGDERLLLEGLGNDATTGAFRIRNSDGLSSLFVRDDRRIGIKNNNPKDLLHIGSQIVFHDGGTKGIYLNAYNDETAGFYKNIEANRASAKFVVDPAGDNAGLSILVDKKSSSGEEVLDDWTNTVHFLPNGNVGISELTPEAKLGVRGETDDATASTMHLKNSVNDPLLFVRNDGSIGINSSSPTSRLFVKGAGNTDATSSFHIVNSDDDDLLYVGDDGNVGINSVSQSSKLFIKSGGSGSSTSSLHIENDVGNDLLYVRDDGNVGIGFTTMDQKLAVNGRVRIGANQVSQSSDYYDDYMLSVDGTIITEKVVVSASEWADHVFNDSYNLMPLLELKKYIEKNKKLPEIPDETEIKNSGVDLAEINARLLQKVEELTLYLIELKSENEEIKKVLKELKEKRDLK